MKNIVNTRLAPAPVGPYNQGIVASGSMLFVSGQIPLDPSTGAFIGQGDIEQQTRQVMANIASILEAARLSWSDVVKTTIYLTNLDHFATVNEIYATYFPADTAPARACVEVSRLPKGAAIEIECIAVGLNV